MDLLETGFVAERCVTRGEHFYSRENFFKACDACRGSGPVKISGDESVPQLVAALDQHLRENGWLESSFPHLRRVRQLERPGMERMLAQGAPVDPGATPD